MCQGAEGKQSEGGGEVVMERGEVVMGRGEVVMGREEGVNNVSAVKNRSRGLHGTKDCGLKEVIGNLGEVIFTDTLETKGTFQRAEE